MRKSNWQFPTWVHIAKQHIRRCGAPFLAQIPPFKYRWNMLRYVIDRKRSAVDQEDNRWGPCFNHRFYQIILRTKQIERIAITAMIFGPSFAIGALVFAHHENGHVGVLGQGNGFLDFVRLSRRIEEFNVIAIIVPEPPVPILTFVRESATV